MIRNNVWKSGSLAATFVVAAASIMSVSLQAQAPAAPRQAGTIKSATASSLVLTTAAGADVTIALPGTTKILIVAPGSKDLKSATPGTVTDIAAGDKTIITGTPGDTDASFNATRVILMKSTAIAESHAAADAAWAQGGGGLVKSVDPTAGTIVVANGAKSLTISTTPSTIVRRYSGDSVRFADAQVSTISAIQPGDQLRVRGTKSPDGSSITADELVTGTFRNFSGLITAIDTTAGTITFKDLATKKTVTVAVTSNSDVRRMPPMAAQAFAARMHGSAAAGGPPAGGPPAGGPPAGGSPSGGEGPGRGAGRAGMDLSQMLSRLPTETLAGLKTGDAVMIVATSATASSSKSTAITLLTGVDAILTAQPTGEMTLTPWSVGGGAPAEGGGGPGL